MSTSLNRRTKNTSAILTAPDLAWSGLRKLQPGYFALVMATGIVAIACRLEGLRRLAQAFVAIDVLVFLVLGAMTLLRLVLFPRVFWRDLSDHNRGVGFFTMIAGTAVLGSALNTIWSQYAVPFALWIAAVVLWTVLIYVIFASFIIKRHKPSLSHGIHGGWLLAVVSTEAIAQLASLLAPKLQDQTPSMLFLALAFWLCGGMLYVWMISLIFYRYAFFALSPSHLLPSYWIDMGAMAIATVVGTQLIEASKGSSIADMAPFMKGFTIMFWTTATWWIPMLVILSVWRHLARPISLVYDPSYWCAVFPLGMYAVATDHLAALMGITFLSAIARYLVYIAITTWMFGGIGMVVAIVSPPQVRLSHIAPAKVHKTKAL